MYTCTTDCTGALRCTLYKYVLCTCMCMHDECMYKYLVQCTLYIVASPTMYEYHVQVVRCTSYYVRGTMYYVCVRAVADVYRYTGIYTGTSRATICCTSCMSTMCTCTLDFCTRTSDEYKVHRTSYMYYVHIVHVRTYLVRSSYRVRGSKVQGYLYTYYILQGTVRCTCTY